MGKNLFHMKYFLRFLKIFIFICCLIQIFSLLDSTLNPDMPSTKIITKNLKDVNFPIIFKLCALKFKNDPYEHYKKVGYEDMLDFFKGKSMYNKSVIGWNGFHENGSTIGSVEG